jgi:predicted AlkP superfamily phosphohydrolase/phosphomutase
MENARSTTTEDQRIYRQLLKQVAGKGALCRHLIREGDKPDLMVVIFGESHTGGHQFWKYSKSDRSGLNGASELTDATRSIYEAIDREMGLLLEQLPPNANVFILSSLGLTDHYPTTGLMESFCRELGYQVPRNSDAGFSVVNLLRRSIPEHWRIAVSRHLSRERRERLLSQQFSSGTDWSKTTAFAVPSIYTGHIRINLRGREPGGIVNPGREYHEVLDRFESDLRQLVDDDGMPAVANVVRTATVFGVDPADGLPDLIVHWRPCSRFVDRVHHPRCELHQKPSEFNRDSDHYERGFMAAAGPAITGRGAVEQIDVLSLAPTFLHLTGSSKSPEMEGRLLTELIQTAASLPET